MVGNFPWISPVFSMMLQAAVCSVFFTLDLTCISLGPQPGVDVEMCDSCMSSAITSLASHSRTRGWVAEDIALLFSHLAGACPSPRCFALLLHSDMTAWAARAGEQVPGPALQKEHLLGEKSYVSALWAREARGPHSLLCSAPHCALEMERKEVPVIFLPVIVCELQPPTVQASSCSA